MLAEGKEGPTACFPTSAMSTTQTLALDRIAAVRSDLAPLRERLLSHPVYHRLVDLSSLRAFCSHHVFAVWDFMSLLKTLQGRLTTTRFPWVPPAHREAARLINEIVVGEESDLDPSGGHCSHYELYLEAAQQLGAPTAPVEAFVMDIASGTPWADALDRLEVAAEVRAFVARTLQLCETGTTWEVAADFVLGRENLIPDMFGAMSLEIARNAGVPCGVLEYYLERHIELDGDEHGPASERILSSLCGDDDQRWADVARVATEALTARISLWDATARAMKG